MKYRRKIVMKILPNIYLFTLYIQILKLWLREKINDYLYN